MNELLLELLHRLEVIGDFHEELFDSEVREILDDAVFRGFLSPHPGYELPDTFRMYSADGDRQIREALEWYLPAACQAAETAGLQTFRKRLEAFQNHEIRTARQNDYNDFFGWANPALFDESGAAISAE